MPRGKFAFVNSPYGIMGKVLVKVKAEHVNCILIAPVWPKDRVSLLKELPITGYNLPWRKHA